MGFSIESGHLPCHSFENVRQFIRRLPECVSGYVGVLLRHGWRIVADEFPRHGIRNACRFEQGGGRVAQRVKADFVLFARDVAAFAGAVMAAFVGKSGGDENLVKLVAQVSGAALPLHHGMGAGEKWSGGIITGRELFDEFEQWFGEWQNLPPSRLAGGQSDFFAAEIKVLFCQRGNIA